MPVLIRFSGMCIRNNLYTATAPNEFGRLYVAVSPKIWTWESNDGSFGNVVTFNCGLLAALGGGGVVLRRLLRSIWFRLRSNLGRKISRQYSNATQELGLSGDRLVLVVKIVHVWNEFATMSSHSGSKKPVPLLRGPSQAFYPCFWPTACPCKWEVNRRDDQSSQGWRTSTEG